MSERERLALNDTCALALKIGQKKRVGIHPFRLNGQSSYFGYLLLVILFSQTTGFNIYLLAGISAVAIVLGSYHTCAIVSGDGVKCWGWNWNGQLGIGSWTYASSPADVAG